MPKKTNKDPQFLALTDEAKQLYRRLAQEWSISDAAGLATLMVACQSLDRLHQAQDIIRAEGIISHDRFGQPKPHPATQIEKEARGGLLQALRALNLDMESLQSEGE